MDTTEPIFPNDDKQLLPHPHIWSLCYIPGNVFIIDVNTELRPQQVEVKESFWLFPSHAFVNKCLRGIQSGFSLEIEKTS